MKLLREFASFIGQVACLAAFIMVIGAAISVVMKMSDYHLKNHNEFTLSQGSIWIRDPKGIDYIDFKVTAVWTICQKCHFDSVAWHKQRKERDF